MKLFHLFKFLRYLCAAIGGIMVYSQGADPAQIETVVGAATSFLAYILSVIQSNKRISKGEQEID